jgi:hypothetical protein
MIALPYLQETPEGRNMPKAFCMEVLERQAAVIGMQNTDNEDSIGFSGVWEETWRARARLAWQAERYRIWLREHGCSREQAAEMAVRLLMAREPDAPPQPDSSNISLIH